MNVAKFKQDLVDAIPRLRALEDIAQTVLGLALVEPVRESPERLDKIPE